MVALQVKPVRRGFWVYIFSFSSSESPVSKDGILADQKELVFLAEPVPDAIHEGFFAEILVFARIEEGAVTGRAGFEFDMRLLNIVDRQHGRAARGAFDILHLIVMCTLLGVTLINFRSTLDFDHFLSFERIEPKPSAIPALIVFNAFVFVGFHFFIAFRAYHNISPLIVFWL